MPGTRRWQEPPCPGTPGKHWRSPDSRRRGSTPILSFWRSLQNFATSSSPSAAWWAVLVVPMARAAGAARVSGEEATGQSAAPWLPLYPLHGGRGKTLSLNRPLIMYCIIYYTLYCIILFRFILFMGPVIQCSI